MLMIALVFAATAASAKARDAYVMCIGGQTTQVLLTASISLPQAMAMRERYGRDFLWACRSGREIVIRDPAFLARADALFAPQRALEPEQNAIAREEKALDEEEDHLEQVAEHNGASVRDRLREIREKQQAVEAREKKIDDRSETLERVAESELWRMIDEMMRKR
jgi:hypothetical protein